MKKTLKSKPRAPRGTGLITLITLITLIFPKGVSAAFFTLDPQTRIAAPQETFSVDVKIDTEQEETTSADAVLKFNSSILSVSSITPGTFFPKNFKTTTASQIYIGGAVENAAQSKSGTGLLATINFTAIGSGASALSFDCAPGKTSDSNITKSDSGATDILDCEKLTNGSYTISGSVTSTQPTPTPKTLPAAGNVENTLIIAGAGLLLLTIAGILLML